MASKIHREKLEAIVVIPLWPTQSWFAYLLRMIINYPLIFSAQYLYLPQNPDAKHPLSDTMKLVAMRLSGNPCSHTKFLKNLKKSYKGLGENPLGKDINLTYTNGKSFVLNNITIPCIHLSL